MSYDKKELNKILKELTGKTASRISESNRLGLARTSSNAVVLSWLAEDEGDVFRYEVARNPSTPIEVLVKLAGDEDKDVVWGVANNPSTPVEVLVKLAGDEDKDVVWGVANNPSTPVEVLVKLAGHEDRGVLVGVSKHPQASTDIRLIFALYASGTIDDEELEGRVNAL